MGWLFNRFFGVVAKYNHVSSEFKQAYKELYLLAGKLTIISEQLKKEQKRLFNEIEKRGAHIPGRLSVEKTSSIDEELIPKLRRLEAKAKSRFNKAFTDLSKTIKPNIDEEAELRSVLALLRKIEIFMLSIEEEYAQRKTLDKTEQLKQRLGKINDALKETDNLVKKFHLKEQYGKEKQIIKNIEGMKALYSVYENSEQVYFCPLGHKIKNHKKSGKCPMCGSKLQSLFEYKMDAVKLRKLEEEAEFINGHNDPKTKVVWRKWWQETHKTEKDIGTGYKTAHINVSIKLGGGPKKTIHIVM